MPCSSNLRMSKSPFLLLNFWRPLSWSNPTWANCGAVQPKALYRVKCFGVDDIHSCVPVRYTWRARNYALSTYGCAYHVGYIHMMIIDHIGQVICRKSICFQKHRVFVQSFTHILRLHVLVRLSHQTINEVYVFRWLRWYSQSYHEWVAGRSTLLRLVPRNAIARAVIITREPKASSPAGKLFQLFW